MIYHIYANQSNIGDWLSAQGIQSTFRGLPVKHYFCDTPFVQETAAALSEADERDFIIIGGGGLFMDYFAPFWKSFLPISRRVPFCIWGAGCCDVKRKTSRIQSDLLNEILPRSEFCIVRDELSRSALPQIELPPPVPCPAFLAVDTQDAVGKRVLNVVHPDIVSGPLSTRIKDLCRGFAERTGREFSQTNNWIEPGDLNSLNKVVSLYASSDLVVTSRLHGCIIALALGRKLIALSGDHKVEAFMQVAHLQKWVLDLSDVESLPEKLDRLHEQILPVSFIASTREKNRHIGKNLALRFKRFEQVALSC